MTPCTLPQTLPVQNLSLCSMQCITPCTVFQTLPNLPSQAQNLSLQHGNITIGVLVDDGLVADVLGPAGKLQRAESLLGAHLAGADIGNDHGLGVATQ